MIPKSQDKKMSNQKDSSLKQLLSPSRSGTFFAPFRSRSANPDGFDSKMKLWIKSIEEWCVLNQKMTFSLSEIQQKFISNSGIRPDKECIRLVLSEMKRQSRIAPLNGLKASRIWSSPETNQPLNSYIDPKSWFGWGVTKLVYNPANWALSAMSSNGNQAYTDLTDMSINDDMQFVCHLSLSELSQNLLDELIRISKAERQQCFEWDHLIELIAPIMNTIISAVDNKDMLNSIDLLVEYLTLKKHIAILVDSGTKLIKIANPEEGDDDPVAITRKDVATARLLRAREFLRIDADKYHHQALKYKQEASECYARKELEKAKSLLRSYQRLNNNAEQKRTQLTNVEVMLDQLENTDSNMMILRAYKDGAEALKLANTTLDNNTSVLDDIYDATAEAHHLASEMNQMLTDISRLSQPNRVDISHSDLEQELEELTASRGLHDNHKVVNVTQPTIDQSTSASGQHDTVDDKFVDELEQKLQNLIVCQDDPTDRHTREVSPRRAVQLSTPAV